MVNWVSFMYMDNHTIIDRTKWPHIKICRFGRDDTKDMVHWIIYAQRKDGAVFYQVIVAFTDGRFGSSFEDWIYKSCLSALSGFDVKWGEDEAPKASFVPFSEVRLR